MLWRGWTTDPGARFFLSQPHRSQLPPGLSNILLLIFWVRNMLFISCLGLRKESSVICCFLLLLSSQLKILKYSAKRIKQHIWPWWCVLLNSPGNWSCCTLSVSQQLLLSCLLLTTINSARVVQERGINDDLWVASPFPPGQTTPVLCDLCFFISLQQIALTTLHQHKLLSQFWIWTLIFYASLVSLVWAVFLILGMCNDSSPPDTLWG